jgi:predicted GIY-YIG superfamily endonuclease
MIKVKLGGIYIITHEPSEKFYIGMSIDIFSRWGSHYTSIKKASHSSTEFMKLFFDSNISDWSFRIIESHSFTKYKNDNKLKGQCAVSAFRTFLLSREKYIMSQYSKNFCLNKNNKWFAD